MDPVRFDTLVKSLTTSGTRRRLVRLLAALLGTTITTLLGDPRDGSAESGDHGSSHRRQRRKARHRHRTGDNKKHRKGETKNHSKGKKRCTKLGKVAKTHKPCCKGLVKSKSGKCGCTGLSDCGVNQICVGGACQPCTVTCAGTPEACGAALQAKLDAGGTVYVCPGAYRPGSPDGFLIASSMTLIGAGQNANPQIDTVFDADQSGRVLQIQPEAELVELTRLHITGGFFGGVVSGAGILHRGTTLRMADCTVRGNRVTGPGSFLEASGGGIYNQGPSALELTRCEVSENHAVGLGGGGGISTSGPMTLTDCRIADNQTDDDGGGIRITGSMTTLAGNTEVRGNKADRGGGVFVINGTLTIEQSCKVSANEASPGDGGGIFADDPNDVTLASAQIVTNNTGGNCEPENQIDNCIE